MRKSRRKPFIAIDAGVILLAILFFVLTGDGLGEGKEGSTNSVIEKKKVVFLTKSMDSSFWQSAYAGAGAASAEYNLDLVTTAPGVIYKVHKTNGEVMDLTNPSNLPDPSTIEYMEEPMVNAEIMVTTEFIGAIMDLCQERRGQYLGMDYMEETRALLKYKLPLNEIIYDFFDALKSRSRGYASFDYEMIGYERSELVKLDILVNKEEVDALSFIVFEGSAYERGRKMCEKLKEEIPRQLFEIPIQAAVGSKIIARETVKAMRKDVLAKCYGGDISRKKKLLEKQKEGKKRMRQVGNVEIPQSAFMSVLKLDDN